MVIGQAPTYPIFVTNNVFTSSQLGLSSLKISRCDRDRSAAIFNMLPFIVHFHVGRLYHFTKICCSSPLEAHVNHVLYTMFFEQVSD